MEKDIQKIVNSLLMLPYHLKSLLIIPDWAKRYSVHGKECCTGITGILARDGAHMHHTQSPSSSTSSLPELLPCCPSDLGDRKSEQILCQCTLGTSGRAGTAGDSTTVGTSHACTPIRGVQSPRRDAWLVLLFPTVMESPAVPARPHVPRVN